MSGEGRKEDDEVVTKTLVDIQEKSDNPQADYKTDIDPDAPHIVNGVSDQPRRIPVLTSDGTSMPPEAYPPNVKSRTEILNYFRKMAIVVQEENTMGMALEASFNFAKAHPEYCISGLSSPSAPPKVKMDLQDLDVDEVLGKIPRKRVDVKGNPSNWSYVLAALENALGIKVVVYLFDFVEEIISGKEHRNVHSYYFTAKSLAEDHVEMTENRITVNLYLCVRRKGVFPMFLINNVVTRQEVRSHFQYAHKIITFKTLMRKVVDKGKSGDEDEMQYDYGFCLATWDCWFLTFQEIIRYFVVVFSISVAFLSSLFTVIWRDSTSIRYLIILNGICDGCIALVNGVFLGLGVLLTFWKKADNKYFMPYCRKRARMGKTIKICWKEVGRSGRVFNK